ncbi:MAG: hypothetical protein TREMPRED_003816 [Tremellales sp. Tagirdzhanova-0007]|nr:MAG: hypothetical protein TREMPRED_003816 [Tremellales sp. Tagirdzhanova-0007]
MASPTDPTAAALAEAQAGMSSRFESQSTIDSAKAQREKEWKEAYARIGQEPPKPEDDQPYDGRTLYEKLQTQKALKTEEWDSKMKLSNQYRGLQTEELQFLAERAKERKAAEHKREEEENAEVREYREAQASKSAAVVAAESSGSKTSLPAPPATRIPPKAVRKDVKSLLKGVVVKKKPKVVEKAAGEQPKMALSIPIQPVVALGSKREVDEGDEKQDDLKKQRRETV